MAKAKGYWVQDWPRIHIAGLSPPKKKTPLWLANNRFQKTGDIHLWSQTAREAVVGRSVEFEVSQSYYIVKPILKNESISLSKGLLEPVWKVHCDSLQSPISHFLLKKKKSETWGWHEAQLVEHKQSWVQSPALQKPAWWSCLWSQLYVAEAERSEKQILATCSSRSVSKSLNPHLKENKKQNKARYEVTD